MRKFFIIVLYILNYGFIFSQNSGEIFSNSDCEYMYFINDSLVEYIVVGNYVGALATLYHGIGKYEINNNGLLIMNINNTSFNEELTDLMIYDKYNCNEFKDVETKLFSFILKKQGNDTIILTGPILDNYKKLNRKRRFLKGLLNWPWKWSFKKQHWYDPRTRILILN